MTVAEMIVMLERETAEMERRYGCTAGEVEAQIALGAIDETADINSWLANHRALTSLRAHGRVTG